MTVNVLSTKKIDKGNLKGFASVEVGGITINDLRIIQQPDQKPWVSGPQREWTDRDGNRKFTPMVLFAEPIKSAIELAVLDAFARA